MLSMPETILSLVLVRPDTRRLKKPCFLSFCYLFSYQSSSIWSNSSSSRSTDTSVDTPFSCMVIPYSLSAAVMVPLLWVMTINCVFFVNLCRYCAKRPTLLSSSAASISSRRQNGDGFRFWIANSRAIAVSAFSPPESCIIF